MATLAAAGGTVKNNISSGDYNTNTVSYQPNGTDSRNFYTARIDYNVTSKNTLSFVYNFDGYTSIPDFLNGIVPTASARFSVGMSVNQPPFRATLACPGWTMSF